MNDIKLYKTFSTTDDIDSVTKVIERGTWWIKGKEIEDFERSIADYVGTKHCITFNSGTSALFCSLLASEIKNKEVILPSFTFIATADAVKNAGGNLVFSDIESVSYCLDKSKVEEKITKNTKVILVMNYLGSVARDINEIRKLADENDIILIEDSAHSLGASKGGVNAGQFGDMAMYSFSFNKIISTGEGGCIVTDSDEYAEKLRLIRSHGQVKGDVCLPGYNLRISSITGALGLSQMNKIDYMIDVRRKIAGMYHEKLKDLPVTLPTIPPDTFCVYQRYTFCARGKEERDSLIHYLKSNDIPCSVGYQPIHRFSYFKKDVSLPLTEKVSDSMVTIPFHVMLDDEQINYITNSIRKFYLG